LRSLTINRDRRMDIERGGEKRFKQSCIFRLCVYVGVRVCVSKLNTGCSTINRFYDIARSSRENRRERECAHWLANVGGLYYYYYSSIITVCAKQLVLQIMHRSPSTIVMLIYRTPYAGKKFDDSTIYIYI